MTDSTQAELPPTLLETAQTAEVRHEPEHTRYTLWLDEENVGLADYFVTAHAVHISHTEISPAFRRQGLASMLTEQVLDHIRTHNTLTVVADCPYVAHWIDLHTEYHDLLTRGR